MLKILLLFCFLLNIIAFSMNANEHSKSIKIPAFKASYNILRHSEQFGSAVRELRYLPNGLAQYKYHTNIEWLIFSDKRQEISLIEIDGVTVTPRQYEFIRTGTGRDKHYVWRYDFEKQRAFDEIKQEEHTMNFPENLQDKLSYHFQHRLNMINDPDQKHYAYSVISKSGNIKHYVFQYDGTEDVMLPYGLVKTVKLKEEVVKKKRVTYIWFAPELDYLLVKLYQSKAGTEQFEVQLKSVEMVK